MRSYKGKWKPKNLKKYAGDPAKIVYRSLWERNAFRYLDDNPNIVKWVSEEVVIPYICQTDGRKHRYYIDLYFETKEGDKYLIEIKPYNQTQPPKGTRKTKRLLNETLTYVKNQSKWRAARDFAKENGVTFMVWTEHELEGLGIKTLSGRKKKING